MYTNRTDFSFFYRIRNSVNNSRSQFAHQLYLFSLGLKSKNNKSVFREDGIQPFDQGSTQRKIGDLSPDRVIMPVYRTGNGDFVAFRLTLLFHLSVR